MTPSPIEQILNNTNVPPVALRIPLKTTTNANIAIAGISEVTIFNSGSTGMLDGSSILIGVLSYLAFILVFLINLG